MKEENPYKELARCILPREISDAFVLVDVQQFEDEIHLYLDEDDHRPEEYKWEDLSPNGFYEEIVLQDFSVRDRRMIWHVRRRRWIEKESGKSVSRDWNLVAKGTRHSKEFAAFLKGMLGEIPDYGPLSWTILSC